MNQEMNCENTEMEQQTELFDLTAMIIAHLLKLLH